MSADGNCRSDGSDESQDHDYCQAQGYTGPAEPGPGPGLDGIPDVGWMITMSGNLRGCNSPVELFEVIFFDSLECE